MGPRGASTSVSAVGFRYGERVGDSGEERERVGDSGEEREREWERVVDSIQASIDF